MFGSLVPTETLLGRWRLTTDLFGRVFCDDVGAEPGSVISELGGFAVKESKFRREMERLRNSQQRDLTLEVESCWDILYAMYYHIKTVGSPGSHYLPSVLRVMCLPSSGFGIVIIGLAPLTRRRKWDTKHGLSLFC